MDVPHVACALLLECRRRMIGRDVCENAVPQQPPQLGLVVIGSGPRWWRELSQCPVDVHLLLTQKEVLRVGLSCEAGTAAAFRRDVPGYLRIADMRDGRSAGRAS